jgi:integration host factor subunit alpha
MIISLPKKVFTMTKADLVEQLYERAGYSKKDAAALIEAVFEIVKRALETGEPIKISGFGNFEVKQKHNRTGRNPQTGEAIIINARRVLSFKPSTRLKALLNNKESDPAEQSVR